MIRLVLENVSTKHTPWYMDTLVNYLSTIPLVSLAILFVWVKQSRYMISFYAAFYEMILLKPTKSLLFVRKNVSYLQFPFQMHFLIITIIFNHNFHVTRTISRGPKPQLMQIAICLKAQKGTCWLLIFWHMPDIDYSKFVLESR